MPFPKKFKKLIETELNDIEKPDYIWLTYAVCATTEESCGWGGWMVEAALKRTKEKHKTITGDKLLSGVDEQTCPLCKKETYRTGASLRFDLSKDQKQPFVEGVDYEAIPPKYI